MKLVISAVALSLVLSPSLSAQDTAHVKAGWNLIGSVKAGAVPEVLSTIPDSLITSSFWGYTPGVGYESIDTLDNGRGYWVKAKSDGLIVFNNAPPVDSCKSKAFIYEGKLYHTVLIGDQCWMAENLDVGVMVMGTANQTDNDTIEKYCYNNDPGNCVLYGGLYRWSMAMQYNTAVAQGICPPGWHIPTFVEFQTLITTVGDDGNALKALSQGSGVGAGTNASGFSALLAGYWLSPNYGFYNLGSYASFWSSTEGDASYVFNLSLVYSDSGIYLNNNFYRDDGFSVRCIED